jgi:hypothetical protein
MRKARARRKAAAARRIELRIIFTPEESRRAMDAGWAQAYYSLRTAAKATADAERT